MSVKLRKGDTVFFSEKGAKGFFYPTASKETIKFDVDATRLMWVGGGKKKAVLIPKCALGPPITTADVIPVWIEES